MLALYDEAALQTVLGGKQPRRVAAIPSVTAGIGPGSKARAGFAEYYPHHLDAEVFERAPSEAMQAVSAGRSTGRHVSP